MKFSAVVVSATAIVAVTVAGGAAALFMSAESSDSRAAWSNSATHVSAAPSLHALVKNEGLRPVPGEDASSSGQVRLAVLASTDGSTVSSAWFPVH